MSPHCLSGRIDPLHQKVSLLQSPGFGVARNVQVASSLGSQPSSHTAEAHVFSTLH